MDIETLIQVGVVAAAIFGAALGLLWALDLIDVCWSADLRALEDWCGLLQRDNANLVKENARLWREVDGLRRLVAIDETARRTTRAMLRVAYDDQRRAEPERTER